MKRLTALIAGAAVAVAGLVASAAGPAHAATGFSISGGRLIDANGAVFVPQGINHAHAWYTSQTSSFANIKAAGANSVRVVLSGGRYSQSTASDVSNVINLCKANKLICILENHDTTGYGEDGSARSLASAADYWVSIASALKGQEAYTLINLGNEPFGNSGYGSWSTDTIAAIKKLRSAGLTHTLVADAPNWGQDWSFTMRDQAATVAAADSNTMFSIHMYGVFDTSAEVKAYIDSFTSRGLPLMVGEFGDNHSDGNPDESTIMSYTRQQGIGMLGWSWSGNGGGVEYLDMVSGFNPNSLTSWGQRFINGTDGLKNRGVAEATVYGGSGGTPSPTPTPTVTSSPTPTPTGGSTAPNGYPYCVNGASSDPDGDGWGWENNRSCVVRGSSADTGSTSGTAPNGYKYCANGSSSDPDGDGWGWENNQSCVVRGSSADR